jgi:hypothetical protein
MIPNPTFLECINKINNGTHVLKSLDIIYDKPITFKNYESVVYYEPEINRFDYIAAYHCLVSIPNRIKFLINFN